jgi:hypothetical protein
MPLTYTYPTLSNPPDKDEIETNFEDVQAKFGSGITNADIASGAAIDVDKLSAQYQEAHIPLEVNGAQLAAGWPAAGTFLAAYPVPGSNGDASWEVSDISQVCTDIGAGTAQYKIAIYERTAASWSPLVGNVATGITLAHSSKILENGSVAVPFSTNVRVLVIETTSAADATALSAAAELLSVGIVLRRKIQA